MASFMEVLQTIEPLKSKLLYHHLDTGSIFRAIFSCRAANKEVQRIRDRHH